MTGQASLQTLFAQAAELNNPAERAAFLAAACGDDAALRRELEILLAAHARAGGFMAAPAADLAATALLPSIGERPGDQIGPYKLLEQIGEGGMGLVFMAEQTRPLRRRVALKIIKPGLDTRAVIARFEAERQALALMDHPNIAKIFDAGTTGEDRGQRPEASFEQLAMSPTSDLRPLTSTAGRPFFVMELVRGAPITDYCREQNLNIRQRLELFLDVCHAVQHAHQKGVIHRDLKPSNILVTQNDTAPVPKVIDFGVAKATASQSLTDKTLFTQFSQIIGTPLYMSPEQADLRNQDIDTRSDVYSLGVVLYELLTGTTPFDAERLRSAGHEEMRRIIREEDPPKPSTRATTVAAAAAAAIQSTMTTKPPSRGPVDISALRGDLDWIVMKALDKDRRRRYESPSALGADVLRYLDNEPVAARPPSLLDRARKWGRRHRNAATAAVITVVLALMFTSAYAADRWRRVRDGTAFVQVALTAVNEALETNDIDSALRRIDEAEARIEASGVSDSELVQAANRLKAEIVRYAQFTRQLERARGQRSQETASDDAEPGLDLYHVLDSADWQADVEALGVPESHVKRVGDGIYELLLLQADHLTRWGELQSDENTRQAIACLDKAISFHEPSRGYYWLRANCELLLGHTLKESELRVQALDAPVHHAAEIFYINRDTAWGSVSEYKGYGKQTLEQALKDHREMLAVDPRYYNGLFFMAIRLSEAGRFEEALVAWYGCLALRPEDAVARKNRAMTLSRLGYFDEARADAEIVVAARPVDAANLMAQVLNSEAWTLATNDTDRNGRRALALAEEACQEVDYKVAAYLDTLAAAYAEVGDFDAAIRWAEEAIRLETGAELQEELDRHLAAFRDKRPWREDQRPLPPASVRLVDVLTARRDSLTAVELIRGGDAAEGLRLLRRIAAEADPVTALVPLEALIRHGGHLNDCVDLGREIAEQLPSNTDVRLLTAIALRSQGNVDEAMVIEKEVEQLAPDQFDDARIADHYAGLGFAAVAEQAFEQILERTPQNDFAAVRLAWTRLLQGDHPGFTEACNAMIAQHADTVNGVAARRVVSAALVPSRWAGDLAALEKLATLAVSTSAGTGGLNEAVACRERALFAYRSEDWNGALLWSGKSRELTDSNVYRAQNLMVEAMALRQLGRDAEAATAYRDGLDFAAAYFRTRDEASGRFPNYWFDWVMYDWLRQEAAELLGVELANAAAK